jgi:hypothetical protein
MAQAFGMPSACMVALDRALDLDGLGDRVLVLARIAGLGGLAPDHLGGIELRDGP